MPDTHPSSEIGQKKTPFFLALRRLLHLSGKYQAWFYAALVLDLGLAAQVIILNDLLRRMFDSVSEQNRAEFFFFTILSLIFSIVSIPLSYLRTRSQGTFSEHTLSNIRLELAVRFNQLPVSYLEERHSAISCRECRHWRSRPHWQRLLDWWGWWRVAGGSVIFS
jgi:ABC-type multidrug transport system fused ATPase/permease subunit